VKAAAVAEGAVEEQAEEDAVPTAVGVADVAAEAPAVGVAEAAIDPAPARTDTGVNERAGAVTLSFLLV
jgi:hypothetical protein